MEKVRSQQEGTGTESGPTLATDTEGREPGGQVSRSSPNAESRNDDALLSSGNKVFAQHHQHGPPESAEQRIRADSSPRGSSSSSKMKNRGLPAIDHSAGQGDSTVHPAAAPGMLPPLNIRGDTSRDIRDSRANSTISFKTAATTVMSAGTMRNFRRSSDAMHVDLLRVFVPDMLINYLENASKPLESQAFFVKAACMCADISGFTALSEKHCKKGTAGLDTLVQIINSYYSNLVNIVYSFGGDIIKIAGDALYCVFMPDEHDLRGAVLCAALCSMQLREVATDGLTLHVGISCGELCFGILGGIDNYWECLMSGEPIGLVADALDEAKKQEVVVSVECMSIIGDCCRGTPLPSRNVLLNALEPPRREKRGSVRMANMIANKGLPVELEPTEGLFAGRAAAAAAAAAATANVPAADTAADPGTGERLAAGKPPDPTAAGAAAGASAGVGALSLTEAAAAAATRLNGASTSGTGAGRTVAEGRPIGGKGGVVDANAAWISSNAKAKERSAGKTSDQALGAAGKMRAEVSSGVLPMLQGFVPGPVTDLLAAGIFMYMAEMRTVTTLFVKLDSYSPEKHKNLLSLQIHLTTIQKILAEHEGFLRQFLVDDKGCVLIACWGVPGRSYPDNGNRCLAAAVEIHASLQVRDMKTSMGITTGHALCGRMGGKIRSEYAMVGDVINLAARLMGKAKGRIVCDEVTHDLVCCNETMVALFKRLDPMMLKGKEHPIAPFVCIAQQGSDMWETHKQLRMIGRIKLQNSVNACLDLIDKGDNIDNPEPSVVVIEGAHGTGKSMVADRVKKSASQFFRRKVHMYAMVQTQSGTPYAGIKGMLRTIFGLDHLGDDAFAVKQALLKTVRDVYGSAEPSTLEVAIGAIKTALGIDLGGETEVEILQASRRPNAGGMLPLHVVHSVISELATHALGNLPAVFILDNVHLMDKMSWKLLIQFLYCPLRLLLVLTATPVEEDIKKRKDLFHAKKKGQIPNLNASMPNAKERAADGPSSVWHGDHGETHLHMQQYIRATQLPITKKFTLSPFTKEELRQLLEHTLAPQDRAGITEELLDTVYGLSGGNPYWCVEVVRFIKENSVGIFMSRIAVQGDGAVGGDASSDGNGGAIVSASEDAMMGRMGILVVCRFERLLVEEQSVVRYASIAGLEFSLSLLHAVLPRNIRPQLELIIQALVTARFVVYSRHTYYKFRNSMVHMVLYNLTPASSRKRMHKAVAQHYIINHGEDPLYLPVMTYHLLQARVEPHQALKFVCKTAAHALVALCYEDCMEALERAVEFARCTSEIHAVLFVHHYISMMHELGHTTVRHAPGSPNGNNGINHEVPPPNRDGRGNSESKSRANSNANGAGGADGGHNRGETEPGRNGTGTTPGKSPGDPETPGSVNSNANAEGADNEGGGGAQQTLGKAASKAAAEGPAEAQERKRVHSGDSKGSRRTTNEQPDHDVWRHTTATTDAGSCAVEAQNESLGARIARFTMLTKEPHARLCSAGQFCPTLQGTFPSPRQQAVDDEHADSLRKHPIPITPRPPKLTSTAGGASDFFEEEAGMMGEGEGEGEGEEEAERERSFTGASAHDSHNNGRGVSRRYLPGHEEGTTSLHSSLGWELAHLLHVCLGHYIKPGGPSPGSPEAADGSYSISTHRLPPEAGEGGGVQPQVSDDEDARTMSRRISDAIPIYGRRAQSGTTGMRTLRSKVSSAKQLLSEHGSGNLQRGLSLQSTALTIGQSVRDKLGRLATGLGLSTSAATPAYSPRDGSSRNNNNDANSGFVGRIKLLPLVGAPTKYEAQSNSPTSRPNVARAGKPVRSSVCVIS